MAKNTTKTEDAANAILNNPAAPKRGRGRPPLPRDSDGNIIREKQPDKEKDTETDKQEDTEPKKEFKYTKSEGSVFACTMLAGTVWNIVGKFANLRELTDKEAQQLGEALDPVIAKYVPILEDWQYEINLLVVISSLYQATKIKNESVAEIIDENEDEHES